MPLFVVATPIGNLDDASPRMRHVLESADMVLCEDTRRTRALFSALKLTAPPLVSCHAHNEHERIERVITQLQKGDVVALVSDAGMPAVSDPGGHIVASAHQNGLPVRVVAGPSSITAAVAVSGFSGTPFHFMGFPPRKPGALRKVLMEASALPGIMVFLESGRRIGKVVEVMAEMMPDREAVICRELTKHYEEVIRGRLSELPTVEQKGEVVVVVGPGETIVEPVQELGSDLKAISSALAQRWGCKKREAYSALLRLEQERDDP